MTATNAYLLTGATVLSLVMLALAYLQMPYTPRRIERQLRSVLPPAAILGYLLILAGAASIFIR